MKKIIVVLMILSSTSAFAQFTLNSSIGFSELAGTSAVLEFNWNDFVAKISGQERREIKESNRSFCMGEYKKIALSYVDIQEKINAGIFSTEQVPYVLAISTSAEKIVDLTCGKLMGMKKAKKLKEEIIKL